MRRYAAEVEQTAYRVVQEALTNVHKHAAGAKTYVRLAHRGAEIAMQVENEAPVAVDGVGAGLPSGGNGLVGMRERVSALGGVFVSGPTDAGVSGCRRSSLAGCDGRLRGAAGGLPGAGRGVGGAGGVACAAFGVRGAARVPPAAGARCPVPGAGAGGGVRC